MSRIETPIITRVGAAEIDKAIPQTGATPKFMRIEVRAQGDRLQYLCVSLDAARDLAQSILRALGN